MGEFDLIEKYFSWDITDSPAQSFSIAHSVGDDAAVLNIPQNHQLVTSLDTLISGIHFPENTPAEAIGHKALAVNLSDLAAMGATPAWFTLALSLPEMDEDWLRRFSKGLKAIADGFKIQLVGGDTTRGPLSITINVMGFVENNKALLRSGASAGDKIYVSGTLGDAALGLRLLQNTLPAKITKVLNADDIAYCQNRLNYPSPRNTESQKIAQYASACIDISDGLLQDLSHLLKASATGAKMDLSAIPKSTALNKIDDELANVLALSGGDDYELLFTVPQSSETEFLNAKKDIELNKLIQCIGEMTAETNIIRDADMNCLKAEGYDHFYGE